LCLTNTIIIINNVMKYIEYNIWVQYYQDTQRVAL